MAERIISADSHVNPPKDLWSSRAPAKLKERAPRVESMEMGDVWLVDQNMAGVIGLDSMAGRKYENFQAMGLTYKDMRPGAYEPAARLADMDQDGVDAEVLYFGGPATHPVKEPELRRFIVQTYNDWMVELAAAAPGRLIALGHVALFDLDEAVAELQRFAKAGLRGFHMNPFPNDVGLPPLTDPQYDRLWAAIQDSGLPVSFHIMGPRGMAIERLYDPTPGVKEAFISLANISMTELIASLTFTGVLQRFPNLHFVVVESGIGWIPYFLERMDSTYKKHRFWTKSVLQEKPSFYWYRQGHATFIEDHAGVALRARAGIDNIMWSTDYPHSDTTWPHSLEVLAEHFAGVPADERRRIVGANAAKLYRLN
jgi:predicted TIM-barrel fold metal-dependent hydrolase